MKRTIYFFFALILLLSTVSCTKDITYNVQYSLKGKYEVAKDAENKYGRHQYSYYKIPPEGGLFWLIANFDFLDYYLVGLKSIENGITTENQFKSAEQFDGGWYKIEVVPDHSDRWILDFDENNTGEERVLYVTIFTQFGGGPHTEILVQTPYPEEM